MQAHWRQTTVGEHGELVLEDLPFEPGQPVEVLVLSKTASSAANADRNLQGSVLYYEDPLLQLVADDDWDALQ